MISFADGYESEDEVNLEALKQLLKNIADDGLYTAASKKEDLYPTDISKIISYLMYVQNNQRVELTVEKELDDSLSLIIERKE